MKRRPLYVLAIPLVALATPALAQSEECRPVMIGDQIPKDVQEHTCTCGPGPHVYPVWGSGPYTVDSPLCSAAVHAGVIGPEGGEITVVRVESIDEWPGSTANGVTTQPWEGPLEHGGYIFETEATETADETEAASP